MQDAMILSDATEKAGVWSGQRNNSSGRIGANSTGMWVQVPLAIEDMAPCRKGPLFYPPAQDRGFTHPVSRLSQGRVLRRG